jgi:2'-5' RNA ligase
MSELAGIFVIAELTGRLAERIAGVQAEHDPRLARLWAPHVTLIGSSGAGPIISTTPVAELSEQLGAVTSATAPLSLTFGAPHRFPGRDIVVLPLDPHGPLRALHEALRGSGIRTHPARYPFTPHCTLTMYPPLDRAREQKLLALRFPEPVVIDRLRVVLTREPQPVTPLLDLPLGGPATTPS